MAAIARPVMRRQADTVRLPGASKAPMTNTRTRRRGGEYASKRFETDAQDIRNRVARARLQLWIRSGHDVAGSSASTAIMAASTASLSPAGRAS